MDRATGDYIGMLATVMNGLALQDAHRADRRPDAGDERDRDERDRRAVHPAARRAPPREGPRRSIFVAGTGNPYFTTDTAAALRAVEIGAEVLLKATKVDGVYDADPMTDPDRHALRELGYADLLRDQLKVLDAAAVSLCMENDLPIVVFDLNAARQHRAGRPRRARRHADLRAARRSAPDEQRDPRRRGAQDGARRRGHGARLPGHPHRPRVDGPRRAPPRSTTTAPRRRSTSSPASASPSRTRS